MPDVDILFESGNRLWGARFGPTKYIASERDNYGSIGLVKRTLNEIYASALGDLKNWRVYQNVSTDSYAASVGSDGEWTGGADYILQGKLHSQGLRVVPCAVSDSGYRMQRC